jgi:trehalose 6-phosphate phosphatase
VDGEIYRPAVAANLLDPVREEAARLRERHPGIGIEDKGPTVAVHYRRAPEAAEEARAAMERQVARAEGALSLLHGKMVLEVKPPAATKGGALEDFLQRPPFAGRRPCYLGDDITDESAFEVCNAHDGVTIFVGNDERPTAARHRLADPQAVQNWLGRMTDGL